ncbi:MAG: hypothetical protein ACLVIY_01160 [Anaerobutyricum soehngenii]
MRIVILSSGRPAAMLVVIVTYAHYETGKTVLTKTRVNYETENTVKAHLTVSQQRTFIITLGVSPRLAALVCDNARRAGALSSAGLLFMLSLMADASEGA